MHFSALVNKNIAVFSKDGAKDMIGNRIKEAREKAGFSQDALAKKLGIGKRTLIDYEKNASEPKASTILDIANYCNVDAGWLLTGQGQMKEQNTLISLSKTEQALLDAFRKLSSKKQEYYFHKIKAEALEEELKKDKE